MDIFLYIFILYNFLYYIIQAIVYRTFCIKRIVGGILYYVTYSI